VLNVAFRRVMNFLLINYSYDRKDITARENTAFKYLDLNILHLLSDGRDINIVQGSVSMDNEELNGYGILVWRLPRNIHQWSLHVEDRGNAGNGLTTCASKIYNWEDEEVFGYFIPTPCSRGGIRITRPDILRCSKLFLWVRRRTIVPCYIAVQYYERLENEECETWTRSLSSYPDCTMQGLRLFTSGFGFAYEVSAIQFTA